jgi:hypothetical protein
MSFPRWAMLLVMLSFTRPLSSAESEAGATFDGVFFPYAVEGAILQTEPKEKSECSCWRAFGAFAGGAGGFFGYMPFALSDSRIGVSDGQRLAEWSAVTAGSAFLGYWIGKKLDRR